MATIINGNRLALYKVACVMYCGSGRAYTLAVARSTATTIHDTSYFVRSDPVIIDDHGHTRGHPRGHTRGEASCCGRLTNNIISNWTAVIADSI